MIKRKKIGNTTITINTETGRQTTSRRSGNITHSQSNQGHNRTTVTFGFGNGWFKRKTTNQNKKIKTTKSSSSSSSKNIISKSNAEKALIEKSEFVGPIYPVFWERKSFLQFDISEWILWLLAAPFRLMWAITIWSVGVMLIYLFIYSIVHVILFMI